MSASKITSTTNQAQVENKPSLYKIRTISKIDRYQNYHNLLLCFPIFCDTLHHYIKIGASPRTLDSTIMEICSRDPPSLPTSHIIASTEPSHIISTSWRSVLESISHHCIQSTLTIRFNNRGDLFSRSSLSSNISHHCIQSGASPSTLDSTIVEICSRDPPSLPTSHIIASSQEHPHQHSIQQSWRSVLEILPLFQHLTSLHPVRSIPINTRFNNRGDLFSRSSLSSNISHHCIQSGASPSTLDSTIVEICSRDPPSLPTSHIIASSQEHPHRTLDSTIVEICSRDPPSLPTSHIIASSQEHPHQHSIQQSWRSVLEILPLFQHLTSLHPVRSIPTNTGFNNRGDLFSRSSLSSNISHHCIQSGASPSTLDSTIVEICSRDPPSLPTSHIIASSQEHPQQHSIQQSWRSVLEILPLFQHLTSLHPVRSITNNTRFNNRGDLFSRSSLSSNISHHCIQSGASPPTLDSTIVKICFRDPPSLPTSHIIASIQEHPHQHSIQPSWRSVLEILPLFQHLTSLHPVRSIPTNTRFNNRGDLFSRSSLSSNISHHCIQSEPFSRSVDSTIVEICSRDPPSLPTSHIIASSQNHSHDQSIQQSWRSVLEILPLFQHLTSLHPVRSITKNTRFNNRGDLFSRSSLSSNISHHCIQSEASPRTLDSTIVEICSRDPPSLPTSHIIASSQEHPHQHSIQQSWRSVLEILPLFQHLTSLHPVRSITMTTLDSTIVEICSRDPPSLPTSHIIASSQKHHQQHSIQQSWRSVLEILPLFQHLTSLHPVRSIPMKTRFNHRGDLFSRSSLSSNISHHCIQSGASP